MSRVPEPFCKELVHLSDVMRNKEVCRQADINKKTLWNITTTRRASPMTLRKLLRAFPALSALLDSSQSNPQASTTSPL